MRKTHLLFAAAALSLATSPALHAAEISTHVLDLARGVGGQDVPVVLSRQETNGEWRTIANAKTDNNGRVRSFGNAAAMTPGTYRLQFDMSQYPSRDSTPFFPEISTVFAVRDANGHYHVPVVVSPFGYSTYRGN